MARILVAYKQFPAPNVGHAGGQSVYRLLEALQARGHELVLVARIEEREREQLDAVRSLCTHVYTAPHHCSLSGPRPLALVRSYLALRRTTLRALRERRPDLLHVEFAQTAFVLLGVDHPCTSFRAHDINWFLMAQQAEVREGWGRLKARLLEALFRRVEPWLYRRFHLIAAISEGDRRLLAPACDPHPVLLLPLSPNLNPTSGGETALPEGLNVLFVGAMGRAFNVQAVHWFLDHVWPEVLAQVPEARFLVVGSNPPEEIQALHDGERIIVTGFVEDLAAWYRSATVFVSPLLVAGGLLQKVVDAMGMGVPVVATAVSNHGLGGRPGEHLLVADEPRVFAAAVVDLLNHPEARARLGSAGQQFVNSHYEPQRMMNNWEAVLLALLNAT